MIKYKLICKNCDLSFDSWFASSDEYEKLRTKKFLNCHNCNSTKVEKTLMAPKLINKFYEKKSHQDLLKFKKINKKIKEYQNFIKQNFEYVGENFAHKARSLYYNKNKKVKGIYGKTSNDDLKELREEGIDVQVIPWVEDKNN
tara:strand:+ start:343 stop:771 length:429 start_codon:yes stop_codon:yes gene_type:complete